MKVILAIWLTMWTTLTLNHVGEVSCSHAGMFTYGDALSILFIFALFTILGYAVARENKS